MTRSSLPGRDQDVRLHLADEVAEGLADVVAPATLWSRHDQRWVLRVEPGDVPYGHDPGPGDHVRLSWGGARGWHDAQAAVQHVRPTGTGGLVVSLDVDTTALTVDQRRRFVRVPEVGRSSVELPGGRRTGLVATTDLSEGGARLALPVAAVRPGDRLLVRLVLPGRAVPDDGERSAADVLVAVPAVVRRVDPAAGADQVAVEFVAPVTQDRVIRRAVLAAQAAQRAHARSCEREPASASAWTPGPVSS